MEDDDYTGTFASPPCFMHEVDPAYMGISDTTDARQRTDVNLAQGRAGTPDRRSLDDGSRGCRHLKRRSAEDWTHRRYTPEQVVP